MYIFISSNLFLEGENDEHTAVGRKKMIEEKKQRDHLLQMNQILAQQVMEKSKAVACKLNCILLIDNVFLICMITVILFCIFIYPA